MTRILNITHLHVTAPQIWLQAQEVAQLYRYCSHSHDQYQQNHPVNVKSKLKPTVYYSEANNQQSTQDNVILQT